MAVYAAPGTPGSIVEFRSRYDQWIGGEYVPPASGQYFENPSPVNGKVFCEVARGNEIDVEREEAHLKPIFGPRYEEYCARVHRFIPGPPLAGPRASRL